MGSGRGCLLLCSIDLGTADVLVPRVILDAGLMDDGAARVVSAGVRSEEIAGRLAVELSEDHVALADVGFHALPRDEAQAAGVHSIETIDVSDVFGLSGSHVVLGLICSSSR